MLAISEAPSLKPGTQDGEVPHVSELFKSEPGYTLQHIGVRDVQPTNKPCYTRMIQDGAHPRVKLCTVHNSLMEMVPATRVFVTRQQAFKTFTSGWM
jgi:hypothetical protein